MARIWVWTFIMIDVILLLPAFYMATGAAGIAANGASMAAFGIAALYLALPVFCLAAPYSAWRAHSRDDDANAVAIAAMPIIYAAFLTIVIFWQ